MLLQAIRDGTKSQSAAVFFSRKMKQFMFVLLVCSYIYSLLESCRVLVAIRVYLCSDFDSPQNTFKMVNTSRSL
jgi:hypothetical protein